MKKIISFVLTGILIFTNTLVYAEVSDIESHWAKKEIQYLESNGLINGYSDHNFLPDKAITRAEFVSIINKGMDLKTGQELTFTDVNPEDWYWKDVEIAVSQGYVKGYDDGTFRPNERINRFEAAVILARVNKLPLEEENAIGFKDREAIPSWAKAEVNAVVKAGIMKGYQDNTFGGSQQISRAEASVSLYRLIKNKEENQEKNENQQDEKMDKKENPSTLVPVPSASPVKKSALDKEASVGGSVGGASGASSPSASSDTAAPAASSTPAPSSVSEPSREKQEADSEKENTPSSTGLQEEKKTEDSTMEVDENSIDKNINQDSEEEQGQANHENTGLESGSHDSSSDSTSQSTQEDEDKDKNTEPTSGGKKKPYKKPMEGINLDATINNAENRNTTTINVDGETRTIFWVKGINPPKMEMDGSGDFRREETTGGSEVYVDYKTDYLPGNHWYDVNKTKNLQLDSSDAYLCFAGVASNLLHWWLEQNEDYVNRFISKQKEKGKFEEDIKYPLRDLRYFVNSFEDQQNSHVFDMFKVYYANDTNGFYSDLLIDLFINGFTPKPSGAVNDGREITKVDPRGGFFNEVFGNHRLTNRMFSGNYEAFGRDLARAITEGKAIGLEHTTASRAHIITLWGAEYNPKGEITAVYIVDSDDQDEGQDVGMKRYNVRNVGGYPKISNNMTNKNAGGELLNIHTLDLGQDFWESYFED